MNTRIQASIAAAMLVMVVTANVFAATGPSTSTEPYLVPRPGVEFTSILTVGDVVKLKHKGDETYRMVGIPDGLGAYDNGDGSITVMMNHELRANLGVNRSHGGKGSFISRWQVRKHDLMVLNGEDHIRKVNLWDGSSYHESTVATFNRLCSADLAAPSAFFNSNTGKGFAGGRIFLNGEENDDGRALAHLVLGREHGTSYELPVMGKAAWENIVASPYEQDKTIVAGLDDGDRNASKLYVYIGEKQRRGNPIQLAGLNNGKTYQLAIEGYSTEGSVNGSTPIPDAYAGRFDMVENGGTGLNRVEDGAWDSANPNRFYFVTTDAYTGGNSRLWRLTFDDISNPLAGGTIEVLVDGHDTLKMMDNMTVDGDGNVYLQEDVGNNVHLGRVWKYGTDGSLTVLAEHDAEHFLAGGQSFLTQDEESSGIIEVTELFQGTAGYDTQNNRYFLLDVQAHYPINAANPHGFANPDDLVEGGQLLLMKVAK